MRIVLDTNILARSCVPSSGPAYELLQQIRANSDHTLVLSPYIVSELVDVLRRPYFTERLKISEAQIRKYVRSLLELGVLVNPEPGRLPVLTDPDDEIVLATAITGKCDVLCSLDRHFHGREVLDFCRSQSIDVTDDVELLRRLRLAQAPPIQP